MARSFDYIWYKICLSKKADEITIINEIEKWIEKLEILCNITEMKKSVLLGTASILQKVLEM